MLLQLCCLPNSQTSLSQGDPNLCTADGGLLLHGVGSADVSCEPVRIFVCSCAINMLQAAATCTQHLGMSLPLSQKGPY